VNLGPGILHRLEDLSSTVRGPSGLLYCRVMAKASWMEHTGRWRWLVTRPVTLEGGPKRHRA
jgi:hypothetical protein